MARTLMADVAMEYLIKRNEREMRGWHLDVGISDDLYEIYDCWMTANSIDPARRAHNGRSHFERARAIPRAVMRALKHTRRGQMLFDTSRYVTYPGMPGGYCIWAKLRKEFRN